VARIATIRRENMKRILIALAASLIVLSQIGCGLFQQRQTTPIPTSEALASPTALVPLQAMAVPTPTPSSLDNSSTSLDFAPTATVGGIVPGAPSGPYAVILVVAGDALNIRSGPGINYPAIGSFPSTTINIMRTGPASSIDGYLWVEVQNPAGGNGWVNSYYLTEYVQPSNFCADARAISLIISFAEALKASSGKSLASLISPAGGWSVQLWREGNVVVFDRAHAQWVFASTYAHNWGAAPQSGQDTVGAIHEVFNAPAPGYAVACNAIQAGGASYSTAWPETYANINYYSVYKPGPAGNELSWRTLLIGIEYVQGQPYIFSTSQLQWEP